MSYKTVLVCLMTEDVAHQLMPVACRISRQFQAHLVGIHTLQAIVAYPGIALHIDAPLFKDFNDRAQAENARIEEIFKSRVAGESFTSEWRSLSAHSVRASEQLIQSAFRVDLVITSRPDRQQERVDQFGTQKDLIVNSGRPVLLIPPDCADIQIGTRSLLAWNATKESAVAACSGLPFMTASEAVAVLTISSSRRHSIESSGEGHEVARYLSRHGVEAEVRHVGQTEGSIGEQILKEAKSGNHDLIVMGAFGHSRLHGIFFGDATDYMLNEADLPVLYAS